MVDIINQTDAVESFDGEEKLGQPMVQFSFVTNKIGTFNFFYLPYHCKRTFAGEKGRFRFSVVIDKDDINYESGAKEWRQDLAFRWNHYFGAFDIGLSHFYGNGREPLFTFDTLELPWKDNTTNICFIPEGVYIGKRRYSEKYKEHIQIADVEGRSLILIHWGNYAGSVNPKTGSPDIRGCVLTGD